MAYSSQKVIKSHFKLNLFQGDLSPVLGYAVITFFLALSDAIMSYFSPVFIEERAHNTFIMGLILSTSSMVGIITDITLGAFTKTKHFHFFFKWAIVGAIMFPLVYLIFPPYTPFLILAMAIWGIYFELNLFSKNHFIHEHTKKEFHDLGWGIIQSFNSIAYLLGPIIAGFLYDKNASLPAYVAIGVMVVASVAYVSFTRSIKKHEHLVQAEDTKPSILNEFKVWSKLIPSLWPLLLFIFILTILDSTMWSVGAVLSDSLSKTHEWGGFLISLYMAPSLFIGVLAHRIGQPYGKKRAAFITALLGGVVLSIAGLVENISLFLLLIFVTSLFTSLAWPEILAVFEDYVDRLGSKSSDLIGLENTMTSLAFVVGPILSGAIAELLGPQATFSFVGVCIVLISVICLVVVKRKIHLPQQMLQKL